MTHPESKAKKLLPANLHPILDAELKRGNQIEHFKFSNLGLCNKGVILKHTLAFHDINKSIAPPWPVVEVKPLDESLEGYACMDSEIGLFGPARPTPTQEEYLAQLSSTLKPSIESECQLGNSIERAVPWSDEGSITVRFQNALSNETFETAKQQTDTIRIWSCWDTHYALEEGLQCLKSRDTIAGPFRIFEQAATPLLDIASKLVEKDFATLTQLSGAVIRPEAFQEALKRNNETLEIPPIESLLFKPFPQNVRIRSLKENKVWKAYFALNSNKKRSELWLIVIISKKPDGSLHLKIEDLAAGIVDHIDEFGEIVPNYVISALHIERKIENTKKE